jgi:hypothetical protein
MKLKKKELNSLVDIIFKTGYDILYPKIDSTIIKQKSDYNELVSKLDELKSNINNPVLTEKITSLELSLEKLIGISASSAKKGEFAENLLESIFSQKYTDITFKKTNHIAHSGDAWLYLPDDNIIMLESKNYTLTVNKDELTKMENDMVTHHILWGLIVSFNSNIQGLKEIDYYTFNHNNEVYNIMSINNLTNDINKLDLALTIIRKLILVNNNLKFPWIVKNIKNDLDDLNNIISKNYLIRDHFISIEKDINKSLNSFYIKLRDSQYELEQKISQIINNIKFTVEESIDINIVNISNDIFELCNNKDKKLGPIITQIIDVLNKKNIIIKKAENWEMYKYNDFVGIIKILNKKIILDICEITINFNIGKEKENLHNIIIIENIL